MTEARSAIAAGADVHFVHEQRGVSVLSVAIDRGDIDAVQLLAEGGVDLWASDEKGMTPLHWAAKDGYAELVGFFNEEGC